MPASWPKPIEIFETYRRTLEAIEHLRRDLLTNSPRVPVTSRFYGMDAREIERAVSHLVRELDLQISFQLVASAEAMLRVDFHRRVTRKGKDAISRRYRSVENARKARGKRGARLDDLLNAWLEASERPGLGLAIRDLRRLIHFRNWIAHGRYWVEDRSGLRGPHPADVWTILGRVFSRLEGFDSLPDTSD